MFTAKSQPLHHTTSVCTSFVCPENGMAAYA